MGAPETAVPWVLIFGDVLNGFTLYGPFADEAAALSHGSAHADGPFMVCPFGFEAVENLADDLEAIAAGAEAWAIITGDPGDGFEFAGPFADADDASKHGEAVGDYWLTRVWPPEVR